MNSGSGIYPAFSALKSSQQDRAGSGYLPTKNKYLKNNTPFFDVK
jgi:hypothetical protein